MILLMIFRGNEPMTGITGRNHDNASSREEIRYFSPAEYSVKNSAGKIEIKSSGLTVKDSLAADHGEFQDDWYWFIGVNLYPK